MPRTKTIYLIDTENLGRTWPSYIATARRGDTIMFFYTEHSPLIHFAELDALYSKRLRVQYVRCLTGENALDFQLVTELGRMTMLTPDAKYVIVSRDKGYDAAVGYLAQKNMDVMRIPAVIESKHPEPAASKQDKPKPAPAPEEEKPEAEFEVVGMSLEKAPEKPELTVAQKQNTARNAYRRKLRGHIPNNRVESVTNIMMNSMMAATPTDRMNETYRLFGKIFPGKAGQKMYMNIKNLVREISNHGPFPI